MLYNASKDNEDAAADKASAPSKFSLSTDPQFCSNPRMKLSDMLIPIGISLILIGLMSYILPKKLFN